MRLVCPPVREISHELSLSTCTGDNPRANAQGLSAISGGQTMV